MNFKVAAAILSAMATGASAISGARGVHCHSIQRREIGRTRDHERHL